MSRRVVITAIGICSSLGFSEGEIVDNLQKGNVSFGRPLFDDDVVVCPIPDFDIKSFTGRFKAKLYRFAPDKVYYQDNRIKFGHRELVDLPDCD